MGGLASRLVLSLCRCGVIDAFVLTAASPGHDAAVLVQTKAIARDTAAYANASKSSPILLCDEQALDDHGGKADISSSRAFGLLRRRLRPLTSCGSSAGTVLQRAQGLELPPDVWGNSTLANLDMPLTSESLGRAIAPGGYTGARLRWSRACERILHGEHLDIVVLGASTTAGAGTNNHPWPKFFEKYLIDLGFSVSVSNQAIGSSTSMYLLGAMDRVEGLDTADIIIVDYAINDWGIDTKYHKTLLQILLELPQSPAVLDFASFSEIRTGSRLDSKVADTRITQRCASAETPFTSLQLPVAQELQVPLLSFSEAVCASGRTWWTEGPSLTDSHKTGGVMHPGDATHDLMARTMLGSFALELDRVCAEGGPTGTDHPQRKVGSEASDSDSAASDGQRFQCLRKPITKSHHRFRTMAIGHDEEVWSYGKDVLTKPSGWIAHDAAAAGDISFEVWTLQGWIQIEFLGTYEGVGSATCWLDTPEPGLGNECVLHGLWEHRYSLARLVHMRTGLPSGRHVLHCRSDGKKFKLLGVSSC